MTDYRVDTAFRPDGDLDIAASDDSFADRLDRLGPESTDAILARARARGRAKSLSYFGEVTPQEAWTLASRGDAKIVDVRTAAEWQYVGHVPGSALVEWRAWRAQAPNPQFASELAAHASRDETVLLLCRSAQRSHAAAIAAAATGFARVLNILEGFEGDIDAHGRRGSLGGWRKAGLPWVQT